MDNDQATLMLVAGGGVSAERALTALYRKYRKPLLGFLLRRGVDAATAEDLVQEAFIKVARSADSFRGEAQVSSWLHTLVRNTHLDHLRRAKPEMALDDEGWAVVEAAAPASDDTRPDSRLEERQREECLDRQFRAFAREHPAAASALERVTHYGWAVRDVAAFLGRTEAATREYLSQCRKKLRALMEPCRELWEAGS
jgi:RNA polymerase sigma factor (sigma-70 family)